MKCFDVMTGAALAVLVLSSPILAAEESFPRPPGEPLGLRFLAEAGNGEYVFIELGSASGGRDAKTVWLFSFHTPPLETPAEPLAARWTRWVYNCDAWTGFPDSDVYLNPSYVMFGGVVPEPGVIAMPEGTVGRLAIDAVCNGNFLYPEGRTFTTIADAVEVVDQIASVPPQ